MSYQNISAAIIAADKTAIQAAIQTIKTKLPFLINLNSAERQQLRKMGPVRTSYVQDVYQTAASNADAIPTGFSITEYGKDLQLYRDLSEIMSWLLPVFEGVESTEMALSNELMKQTDECYGHLKVAAKKNSKQALGQAVKNIADQLKQNHKTKPTSIEPGQ